VGVGVMAAVAVSVGRAASPAAIMELFRKVRLDRGKGFLLWKLWSSPQAFPQWLKPHCNGWLIGGTEVPPFQSKGGCCLSKPRRMQRFLVACFRL